MDIKKEIKKQAILVVSFGTSHAGTRSRSLEAIEQELRDAFPTCAVYRAWTSKRLIDRVREEGYEIDTVEEALDRMEKDGVRRVVVQPTHILDAKEHKEMKVIAFSNMNRFEYMAFGTPLLRNHEADLKRVVEAVMEEFAEILDDTALVFMGHGTTLDDHGVYQALEMQFRKSGYDHVFVGIMRDQRGLDVLKNRVEEQEFKKVILAPFLLSAGSHATKDMAGAQDNSWKSQFFMDGMDVTCRMKGLGEYPAVRRIFVEHAGARLIHM